MVESWQLEPGGQWTETEMLAGGDKNLKGLCDTEGGATVVRDRGGG